MRTVLIVAFTSFCSSAWAAPFILQEICTNVENCEGDEFTLELLGTPPERIKSSFGDFSVDRIARAGEITSKIRLSDGQEWTATSQNDLLTAFRVEGDKHENMYVTKTSTTELLVTFLTQPLRYADYTKASNGRRAFSGKCEQEF